MKSLNFEELREWCIKNEYVLLFKSERHDVLEAKQKELKNWIDHICEEVEDKNYISVRSHVVYGMGQEVLFWKIKKSQ